MADGDGSDDDFPGGTYSRLLFEVDDVVSLDNPPLNHHSFGHSPAFCHDNSKPPKMLCFGDYNKSGGQELVFAETNTTTHRKSGLTCSTDSSTASSGNAKSHRTNRKRVGTDSGHELTQNTSIVNATRNTGKRVKQENNPAPTGHVKVRREKLGERITALQQLVSPYGKTDTASVLHEAMGYIRFLHDQVQVLCSPYLQVQGMPSTSVTVREQESGENGGQANSSFGRDLKSRGLCLVPAACSLLIANSNGADFWSPAMAMANESSNNNVPFAPPTNP